MTRKHFEAIAKDIRISVVASAGNPERDAALYVVACDLASTFSSFNANFNRTRFLTACGF